MQIDWRKYIESNPEILRGKPRIKDTRIPVSLILGYLAEGKTPDEIIPNKHGVVVRKGPHSGLFLPQVWEHFPNDKESFMGELCSQKAGLPRDEWKKGGVELYTFTVFSFEEK